MPRLRPIFGAALIVLMFCIGGEKALVNAYVDWIECFDNPDTVDLGDVHGLIVKSIPHHDPMHDVRSSWLLVLRSSSRVVVAETSPQATRSPEPPCPRAPPVA
jgi:hypothetical protein